MELLTLENFLRYHSKNIQHEKCVLFLGPLFGATKIVKEGIETEEPVHQRIRNGLNSFYTKEKGEKYRESDYLDCQFDNLFILKNARKDRALDMLELRFQLSELYQSLVPTAMYEQIARLPLNAIITCTPDLLLRNTFQRLNVDHDFFYYSPKQQPERPEARSNVPIIYNLFGSADDTNSFIITHEAFFKFVFTMLGDNQDLPVPLRNIIKKADLFLMLGFDLSKWYIPLIMRKLNEERGREPDERASILNKAAEYTDDDEQKMSAKIFVLDVAAPSEVIDKLSKEVEKQNRLRPISATPPQPKVVLPSADARALLKDDKLNDAITLLIKLFGEKQLDTAELYQQSGRLSYIDSQKNAGTMNDDPYKEERNKIRAALLASCNEIDQKSTAETVS
jgi:hypothetical protein